MKIQHAENAIGALKVMGHPQKAEVYREVLDEAILYKAEAERLLNIFKKLDKLHQPYTHENPLGMLDSLESLLDNTRKAINAGLGKED